MPNNDQKKSVKVELELSDEAYEWLQRKAEEMGLSLEEAAMRELDKLADQE